MHRFAFLSSLILSVALAGCQTTKRPAPSPDTTIKTSSIVAQEGSQIAETEGRLTQMSHDTRPHHLAGRTLTVASGHDLHLQDKEVILSFDDGPIPGRTDRVLATLDQFGVKGAFMMVGEMAELHPELARKVAMEGNTIGSHTYRHDNLATLAFDMAMKEITRGAAAVTKATGVDVNFFRFPYLADSHKLRAAVAMRDMVVMDVDVDSKDYLNTSPATITKRTMDLLHRRGRGIILMHDIHNRTATMLPTLLSTLEAEGYKVVTLQFEKPTAPAEMASL
ncbi:peptidoglycan/xylan/chitin deacetylase (PgdA/CDA1 family) [Rhizobium tibeticum]|uniref:Chitooligosaccharide deacetylase n=1 Tax=Rhizobium tibeticum TaxID=501024 RepID=A0A1H8GG57_9HYPH|nr:polysaccharide deacetylase family protein [Rhizobium tibeticum]MDP9808629.1 peptidoglycan/xylan/chitin deacetylase (PgdA/CDA1 family) [Rhizobium tibeticum]SEH61396.1 Bifunctional xylanase/deacetylase precursor [Rhizobium tibeticum]SEN42779.1 Peptidoglycan/xylan/chitin deacetylase, PgdA/CDA1 family [Rhizobium tibeticum]